MVKDMERECREILRSLVKPLMKGRKGEASCLKPCEDRSFNRGHRGQKALAPARVKFC